MIRFDRAAKRYPSGREALADVSFEVQAGEMVFLTGHSGAGKSTVLKLVALIERATRGQVLVAGQNLAQIPRPGIAWYRRQIGMVFQDHKLLHDRPVWDNVALPLVIAGTPRRELDKRVRASLDQVGLLGREKSFPVELSTGEQQRVGIARAVVTKPPILIADEPTGNLDPDLSVEVMKLFRRFNDVGVTVMIASHDLHLIDTLGCRRIVLAAGRTVDPPPGTPGELPLTGGGPPPAGGSRGSAAAGSSGATPTGAGRSPASTGSRAGAAARPEAPRG